MKNEIKRGYKCVVEVYKAKNVWSNTHCENIDLTSFSIMAKCVKYKIDKWTNRPKNCGPLAIFKYRSDARSFIRKNNYGGYSSYRSFIYECEYVESKEVGLWYGPVIKIGELPEGTVFADKVRLKNIV